MNREKLSVGDFGDEVSRLHGNLKRYGLEVSNEEIKRKFFGPSTREAVAECQKRHGLGVTCEVDEATATVLEATLGKREKPISTITPLPYVEASSTVAAPVSKVIGTRRAYRANPAGSRVSVARVPLTARGGNGRTTLRPSRELARRPKDYDDDDGDVPDWPGTDFAIQITSPTDGSALRPGTVMVVGTTTYGSNVTVTGVGVQIGDDPEPFKKASPTGPGGNWSSWSFSGTLYTGSVTITAGMSARFPPQGTGTARASVKVVVDDTAPSIAITEVEPGNTVEGPGPVFLVTIRGTAADSDSGVGSVSVSAGGESFPATSNSNWRKWNSIVTLRGEYTHTISVKATDRAGNESVEATVVTTIDTAPPVLEITQPVPFPNQVTQPVIEVLGTASDGTGVDKVYWQVNQGDLKPAFTSDDWSTWRALIPIPGPGDHIVRFVAQDSAAAKNQTVPIEWKFNVPALGEVQGLSLGAYLRDLLNFAKVRIEDANGSKVSDTELEKAFYQPFARLDDSATTEAAMRPVSQVRVCVEVLRRFLGDVPAEVGTRYREAAYYSLLLSLGTSYEEIRLVRGADDETRKALAARLGIALLSARPNDELDQLLLAPERLAKANSEKDLESLFGLVDTRRDPLEDGPQPKLLKWQKQYLRVQWGKQDHPVEPEKDEREAEDESTTVRIPTVEPDIVDEGDLKGTPKNNPAFDLWQARTKWVKNELDDLREKQKGSTVLQGFNNVVKSVLGAIDLEKLQDHYEDGIDIGNTLEKYALSLSALLHLVRIRRLAGAGTVLEEEWEDVFSILVQVKKRRDQYGDWREEERLRDVTLGPDYFRLTRDNKAVPEPIARWRRRPRDRRRWEQTLEARIGQDQGVKDSLAEAVAAVEESTMPLLRDALIATIKLEDNRVDIADWLTERLQIDVRSSGRQRTTRLHQAIETLQGVLFSLRTGRLEDVEPLNGPLPFSGWQLTDDDDYTEQDFDEEWRWVGAYESWRAALFVFGYPENYLLPSLLPPLLPPLEPRRAFWNLVESLRLNLRLTPKDARTHALNYLSYVWMENESAKSPLTELTELIDRVNLDLPDNQRINPELFQLTERRSEAQLTELRRSICLLFEKGDFNEPPASLAEIGYFVPVLIALQLQKAGQYLAALDWFQCVYAYHFPLDERKIYHGLVIEEEFQEGFLRPQQWLLNGLNPHEIVGHISPRANAYTRFTVMSLVRCFLDFADAEFTRATNESMARARTLYLTAVDLLDDIKSPTADDETALFPSNPLPASLRLHAEVNLFKLRSGRNIAGLELVTAVEPPASENLPILGSGGQIMLPTSATYRPTPYRFAALIARAKELVAIAQQMEAAFLATLEKRDAEAYSLLQARQHIQLSRATVTLQDLRVTEARRGITLAELQRERAEIQRNTYDEWLDEGLSRKELAALILTGTSAVLHGLAAAGGSWKFWEAGEAVSSAAAAASTSANLFSMWASYERREQEWTLQKNVADKDVQIGGQQIALAEDNVRVVAQERAIADMQVGHAEAAAEFLATKFTNLDLYDFMSGVLGRVYGYFLQQASATAALAESQLAFERQEASPAFIQADYWQSPSETGSAPNGDGQTVDRRGLTGSARLLQDIYRVDQHAFETRKRLLQLSHTISVANLAPFEFQLFRETGVLPFSTPMDVFDRGFPGHYLRLIKRVRVSIIALVPPVQGVRATLTASGLSRVTIADAFQDAYQTIVVRRPPEQIAFATPINATGLLELEPEGELLLPFESMGVDTTWELALPKASNPFDFRTIADVLVTVEYTALHSPTYREQVIRQLDSSVSADRGFSFRNDFPDVFYTFNNPTSEGPIVARFETRRADFPPNVDDLQVQHVLLYFVRRGTTLYEDNDGAPAEIPVAHFLFTAQSPDITVGGAATSTADGIISTRRGNGSEWKGMIGLVPAGTWELALGDEMRPQIENGDIEDIVFMITYAGRTPAWPGQLPQ